MFKDLDYVLQRTHRFIRPGTLSPADSQAGEDTGGMKYAALWEYTRE